MKEDAQLGGLEQYVRKVCFQINSVKFDPNYKNDIIFPKRYPSNCNVINFLNNLFQLILLSTGILILMLTACQPGYYGTNCSMACSPNCKTCRHTDCLCSCKAGWMGHNCSIGNNQW